MPAPSSPRRHVRALSDLHELLRVEAGAAVLPFHRMLRRFVAQTRKRL